MAEVTKEWLATYIRTQPDAKVKNMVGRALVALYRRQTAAEQRSDSTVLDNDRGFSACDAKSGSLTARAFLRSGTLEDWQLQKWIRPTGRRGLPRICRYDRQLNEVASERG